MATASMMALQCNGAVLKMRCPMALSSAKALEQWDSLTVSIPTANAATLGSVTKAAATYGSGVGCKCCLNGGTIAADGRELTNGYPTLGTSQELASSSPDTLGGSVDNMSAGYIRHVRYWPRVLSNAEMQAVTAQ